jgi:hypothetical protein
LPQIRYALQDAEPGVYGSGSTADLEGCRLIGESHFRSLNKRNGRNVVPTHRNIAFLVVSAAQADKRMKRSTRILGGLKKVRDDLWHFFQDDFDVDTDIVARRRWFQTEKVLRTDSNTSVALDGFPSPYVSPERRRE